MDIEKFTDRAKGFVQAAQTIALRDGHQQIETQHLAKALLDDPQGMAAGLMQAAGANPRAAKADIDALVTGLPKVQGGGDKLYMTPGFARTLDAAEQAAQKAGDAYVTVERLLLALVVGADKVGEALKKAGLAPQALERAIQELRKG